MYRHGFNVDLMSIESVGKTDEILIKILKFWLKENAFENVVSEICSGINVLDITFLVHPLW